MACLLKLVRLNDFAADIDELDLLSGGFGLAADGYMPVAAPYGAQYVDEPLTLKITGTSKDDLASKIHSLDEKIKQTQWWIENQAVERYQVWIRSQLDNESLPRQAMLTDIRPPDKVRVYNPVEINANYIGEYTLGITRTAYWEDPYPYPNTTAITALSSCGGMAQMSETINGDVPARIASLDPTPNGSAQFGEYWIGWKSDRFGNPANFQSTWSLRKSIYKDTDTTSTADATAVDGNRVTCTFSADATLIQRTITQVNDVVSDTSKHADQRGTYQVLLRAKMSDNSSTARVRMLYSFSNNASMYNPAYRSLQNITTPLAGLGSDYWKLYPMGIVSIPSLRITPNMSLQNAAISIQAQRTSGSGSLHMDCLVLIPVDDGAIHVASANSTNSSAGFVLKVCQAASGDIYSFGGSSLFVEYSTTVSPVNYTGLIANGSKPYIVVAGQKFVSTTAQNLFADKLDVAYTYIPRWRALRGNET